MKIKIYYAFVAIFSSGWVLPGYLGLSAYLSFIQSQTASQINSFPFLNFSKQMFGLAVAWLALVIMIWTVVFVSYLKKNRV